MLNLKIGTFRDLLAFWTIFLEVVMQRIDGFIGTNNQWKFIGLDPSKSDHLEYAAYSENRAVSTEKYIGIRKAAV